MWGTVVFDAGRGMTRPAPARIRTRSLSGLPSASGLGLLACQCLGSDEEVGGKGDDLHPEPVLGVAAEGPVAQAGCSAGTLVGRTSSATRVQPGL